MIYNNHFPRYGKDQTICPRTNELHIFGRQNNSSFGSLGSKNFYYCNNCLAVKVIFKAVNPDDVNGPEIVTERIIAPEEMKNES